MNWEICKPPLELGPCENQERKGKTRNQKKALSNLSPSPPTSFYFLHPPAQLSRSPPSPYPLLCRVMADPTPCSSSAVPYTSTLPPLPTPPYRPHSLVNYINDFTLPDPTDLSSGAPSSATAVESGNVTAWNFRSIRFSLDDTMLERLENRLEKPLELWKDIMDFGVGDEDECEAVSLDCVGYRVSWICNDSMDDVHSLTTKPFSGIARRLHNVSPHHDA